MWIFQAGEEASTKAPKREWTSMFEETQGHQSDGGLAEKGGLVGHEATRGQIP